MRLTGYCAIDKQFLRAFAGSAWAIRCSGPVSEARNVMHSCHMRSDHRNAPIPRPKLPPPVPQVGDRLVGLGVALKEELNLLRIQEFSGFADRRGSGVDSLAADFFPWQYCRYPRGYISEKGRNHDHQIKIL